MRTLCPSAVGLLLCIVAGAAWCAPQGPPPIIVPTIDTPPQLDGHLSDAAWERAATVGGFSAINALDTEPAPTQVRICHDAENLYLAFICAEPTPSTMVTETSGTDGPVYSDDCVELTLDPANGKTMIYHWAVNSRGVIWDAEQGPTGTDAGWNGGATARCSVGDASWVCEMRVPFAGVAGPPNPGETWGINFCRERRAGDVPEFTAWHPAHSGFSDPVNTGEIVFAPAPGAVVLRVLTRGALSADAEGEPGNVFRIDLSNHAAAEASAVVRIGSEGVVVAQATAAVPAGGAAQVALPYPVPPEGRPGFSFTVAVNGNSVHESTRQAVRPMPRGPRVWVTEDPLYEPLLTDRPPGLRTEGVLIWGHLNDAGLLRETARRFGIRYVLDEVYQLHGEHDLHFIGHGTIRHLNPDDPWVRWQVKNLPTPGRLPEGVPWILDPRAIDATAAEIEAVFTGPHPLVWGIYAGDEVAEYTIPQGAELMRKPGDYAYIHEADAEVKRDFGNGQFGIPAGILERDPDPYKWIAYRRFCHAKLRERNQRIHDIVREYAPGMPIVSTDEGGVYSYEQSSQAELFDIFTQQSGPRGRWRAQVGCVTKVLADLTGKEVWPCVHIENYMLNTTPEETVEEISQVFRNGGTGLHLFLSDIQGGRKWVLDTKVTAVGSPRRWHTLLNIVDLLKTMPVPKYPDYDRTAILFNDDTLAAQPYDAKRPYGEQTESCYTMLGPVARSWFKFIDCAQVIEWPSLRARFDIIYLPTARYQRPEIVQKLMAFVREGGTLVCGDPHAFETDIHGAGTSGRREELFGVRTGEALAAPVTITTSPRNLGGELTVIGEAYSLQSSGPVPVLVTYADGNPAIVSNKYGEGTAILFGFNPFSFAAVEQEQWRTFFTELAGMLGQPTGLDIWRFTLPDSVIWQEPEDVGVCLTNNRVIWQEEKPHFGGNRDVGATYSYSAAPDAMPDVDAVDGVIACSMGHLTDRREAIYARKTGTTRGAPYDLPAARWMSGWATPEPVTITVDLKQAYTPVKLSLWFCDTLSVVTVEGGTDGTTWRALGSADGQQAGVDVYDLHIPLDQTGPCRYIRITLAAREPAQPMTLVEMEVWGRDTGR